MAGPAKAWSWGPQGYLLRLWEEEQFQCTLFRVMGGDRVGAYVSKGKEGLGPRLGSEE